MSMTEADCEKWNLGRKLPPEPTHHLPGTEEKIAVMAQRVEDGYHPSHPDDAQAPETSLNVPQRCLGRKAGTRKLRLPFTGWFKEE